MYFPGMQKFIKAVYLRNFEHLVINFLEMDKDCAYFYQDTDLIFKHL